MDMVDVLINLHPDLSSSKRLQLDDDLRDIDGVISVHFNTDHPHLMTLEYNPARTSSATLLKLVNNQGIEASRIGF